MSTLRLLKNYGLLSGFIASFLAVGVPYWLIPYNKLNLPDALIHAGLLAVGFSSLLLRSGGAPFWKVTSVVGGSVPAAVFTRVIADGMKDPTSHNLWPLEIIIAILVGFGCALAGTIAGSLAAKLFAAHTGVGRS